MSDRNFFLSATLVLHAHAHVAVELAVLAIMFWDYFVARAYIVHVYAKRTCINAYLTMTRPKGSKVLSSHCVQLGL
jgi:hypothetical protein